MDTENHRTGALAAASILRDIDQAGQRTFRALIYGTAADILLLWGMLTALGYLVGQIRPHWAASSWIALHIAGYALSAILLYRSWRPLSAVHRLMMYRVFAAQFALVGFGLVVLWLFWPAVPRQIDAFWPLLFALAYVVAGLWVGRFFLLCGLVIGLLTIAGYLWAGEGFGYWMVAVQGTVLVSSGLWLRRAGAGL